MSLTSRQTEVYEFIKGFVSKFGYPPTHSDIAKKFEFKSPNSAADHLKRLRKAGVVDWVDGVHRSLRIVSCET